MKIQSLYVLVLAFAHIVSSIPRDATNFNTTIAFPTPGTCGFHMVVHETCEQTNNKKLPWVNKRYGNISALIDGAGVRYNPGPGHENFLLDSDRHYFNYGNADWDRYLGVWTDRNDRIYFVKPGPCYWFHTGGNTCGRCGVGDWTAGMFLCSEEKKVMHRYFDMDCSYEC